MGMYVKCFKMRCFIHTTCTVTDEKWKLLLTNLGQCWLLRSLTLPKCMNKRHCQSTNTPVILNLRQKQRSSFLWKSCGTAHRGAVAGKRWQVEGGSSCTVYSERQQYQRSLDKLTCGVIPWQIYMMGIFSVSGPWSRHKSLFREFCS